MSSGFGSLYKTGSGFSDFGSRPRSTGFQNLKNSSKTQSSRALNYIDWPDPFQPNRNPSSDVSEDLSDEETGSENHNRPPFKKFSLPKNAIHLNQHQTAEEKLKQLDKNRKQILKQKSCPPESQVWQRFENEKPKPNKPTVPLRVKKVSISEPKITKSESDPWNGADLMSFSGFGDNPWDAVATRPHNCEATEIPPKVKPRSSLNKASIAKRSKPDKKQTFENSSQTDLNITGISKLYIALENKAKTLQGGPE